MDLSKLVSITTNVGISSLSKKIFAALRQNQITRFFFVTLILSLDQYDHSALCVQTSYRSKHQKYDKNAGCQVQYIKIRRCFDQVILYLHNNQQDELYGF